MVPLFLGQDSVAGEVSSSSETILVIMVAFFCQNFFSICHLNQIEFPDFQPHTFATWTFESAVLGILSSNPLSGWRRRKRLGVFFHCQGICKLSKFCVSIGCILWMQVRIEPLPGKKVEHLGVKIELLGQIGTVPSCIVVHCCSKLSSLFVFFFCFIALCLLFFLSADMLSDLTSL